MRQQAAVRKDERAIRARERGRGSPGRGRNSARRRIVTSLGWNNSTPCRYVNYSEPRVIIGCNWQHLAAYSMYSVIKILKKIQFKRVQNAKKIPAALRAAGIPLRCVSIIFGVFRIFSFLKKHGLFFFSKKLKNFQKNSKNMKLYFHT